MLLKSKHSSLLLIIILISFVIIIHSQSNHRWPLGFTNSFVKNFGIKYNNTPTTSLSVQNFNSQNDQNINGQIKNPYTLYQSPDYLDQELFIGQYSSLQNQKLFGYLDSNSGDIELLFYTNPFIQKKNFVNTLDVFLFNPIYRDGKGVGISIQLNQHNSTNWTQTNISVTYATFYKKRQEDQFLNITVNYTLKINNAESQDPKQTTIDFVINGPDFNFSANFKYYNQTLSTLGYSLYVTFIVSLQIVACFFMLKDTDINANFFNKLSLTTVAICNIEDFYLTMVHIEYIMQANNSYMFFVLPALSYVLLFVVFDMKMLFLVWRGHYMGNIDNPQDLRKKLTTFYIKFYIGLFLYLSLNYFFTYDQWMIILQNLFILPQIIHNARIGNNPGFSFLYIFGYLGLRFFLQLYERTCPNNHFLLTPMPVLIITIGLIQLFMIAWLYFQFTFGPRFFIPKFLRPNYFNYFVKVRMTQQNKDLDCTICLLGIFQDHLCLQQKPQSLIGSAQSNFNQNKQKLLLKEAQVMKTPCNHYFHKQCLTKWIDVKLECPTCRKILPPV